MQSEIGINIIIEVLQLNYLQKQSEIDINIIMEVLQLNLDTILQSLCMHVQQHDVTNVVDIQEHGCQWKSLKQIRFLKHGIRIYMNISL